MKEERGVTLLEDQKPGIDDDDDPDTQCGVGSCKPRALQRFATIGAFTGFYSIAGLLANTLLSYVNSQVTTLERQFGLRSSETGIIMASNDIGYIILAFFIGHFAHRAHIPRVMSITIMLFGISGLICCLPHFVFGAGQTSGLADDVSNITSKARDSAIQLCVIANNSVTDMCAEKESLGKPDIGHRKPREHASVALTIIIIGMVLQGMAKAPRNPFVITYVDGNVEKVKTGYYMGIVISLSIFGPAVAFGLGSYFTRLYVTLEDTDLYPRHPRWIGAWWLGYLVFGVASIIVSIPVFFFPRKLKSAPEWTKKAKQVTQKSKTLSKRILKEAKDYLKNLFAILTNPVYLCVVLASVFHLFTVGGAHAFMPKYLENQFGLPAWKANLLMGGLSMPAASLGTFVGGWLTKKYKVTAMTAIKIVNIGMAVTVALVALGFVFGCPQPDILGHPGSTTAVMTSEGNCSSISCHCKDDDYFPICGSDNNNYYSPCHAGCLVQDGPNYENCSCIANGGKASAGMCDFDCPYLYPYAVSKAITSFISTMLIMPKVIVTIRSVTEKEKPMAVAFSTCVTSLFGWLLGPIVYGRLIDSSCLVWDSNCGERGACALYNIGDFRLKMHGFYVGARGLSLLTTCIAMIIAMRTKIFERNAQEEGKEEMAAIK